MTRKALTPVFDTTLLALLGALAGTAFLYTVYRHVQDSKTRATRRAAFLDAAMELFTGGVKLITPDGFPRISGSYEGLTFDIQAVPDTLNVRKLPTLWVLVSLAEPMPVRGTLDIMMRPRGVEYFSRHASLPLQLAPDPALPPDCTVRTDAPEALPPREIVLKHARILEDPLAKELVISPKGLRLVWLAEEAHRGRYLIFRDAEMGLKPFEAAVLKPLLDHLLALRQDLLAAMPETHT
jgi:hypothetical protein